jgi:beta-ureidopropionase / N-carbamoyl-L-amino-acid hydrolase
MIDASSSLPPSGEFLTGELRTLAERLFDQLRQMSFDGVGISRETYGPSETAAMELIEKTAIEHGFKPTWDAAKNLSVRLEGQQTKGPVVATGSHLDSVPQGGNFDGAAGVVAGLIALIAARDKSLPLNPIELISLRGEESAWFGGPCYFGSRAIFGNISEADLNSPHRLSGENLGQHMKMCGVDLSAVEAGHSLRTPEDFKCWIELHIEQGPVLIAKEKPVGVVTGIRGNIRHRRVVCKGEAAHSGAVPRWLRHDAALAMAELLMRLDEHWRVLLAWGEDLVFTTGIIETDASEHAISRVPGQISFALEYRSQDDTTLSSFGKLIETECAQIASKRGVTFDLGEVIGTKPARMSEGLFDLVEHEAQAHGLEYEMMPSGAGHDAAVFANAGVPSTMVFVRNDKGSHNPDEQMEYGDFFKGAELLARSLWRAANSTEEWR